MFCCDNFLTKETILISKGLTGRCKSYNAEKYEYLDFIPLSAIKESTAPGYQVRLAFYAQASRNAHVLLSRTATPNLAEDNVYEFSKCW